MKRVEQVIAHIAENINGKAVLEIACGCAEFSLAAAQTASSSVMQQPAIFTPISVGDLYGDEP